MKLLLRYAPLLAAIALVAAACGDATAGGGAPCAPVGHRAVATVCVVSAAPPLPDAGTPPTCTSDADCTTSGSGYSFCRGGLCSFDECLADSDCTGGGACGCSTDYYGGNSHYHPNVCVPATCHVDSDCGDNGVCAPTQGNCGTLESFRCGASSSPACSSGTSCIYSDQASGFTCGAPAVCNG